LSPAGACGPDSAIREKWRGVWGESEGAREEGRGREGGRVRGGEGEVGGEGGRELVFIKLCITICKRMRTDEDDAQSPNGNLTTVESSPP
jgi:hypothetical protein